ncbi:MAG: hypothetical protein UHS51_12955, partial [Atopobiaceae bacterium]|nr:hypothetical protein [Atopobiaceae bacterium]
ELETIEFDAEDVITDSDGNNPTGPEEPRGQGESLLGVEQGTGPAFHPSGESGRAPRAGGPPALSVRRAWRTPNG